MNNLAYIIGIWLLGLWTQKNDINLATNQSILFLLLGLICLNGKISSCCSSSVCPGTLTNQTTSILNTLFPGQFV